MFGFFRYTEAKLAKEIIAILKQYNSDIEPVYNSEDHSVRAGSHVSYLGNIFANAKSLSGKKRKAFIEGFMRASLFETEYSLEECRGLILPRIKTRFEQDIRSRHVKKERGESYTLPSHALTDSFAVELVIDSDYAVRYINQEMLTTLGISFEQAYQIARENLQALNHTPFSEIAEGISIATGGDDHDAARLLLTLQIESLSFKGDPVAIVPTANMLLLCGSNDNESLEQISEIAKKAYGASRPRSLQPLIMKNGIWHDYSPAYSEEFAVVHNLIKIENQGNYNESKNVLEQENEANEIDVFVASYTLFGREDSPFFLSNSVWTEDVPTWLPQTDQISFVDLSSGNGEMIGSVEWDKAIEHFGELFTPVEGVLPPRFAVTGFPSKETIRQLSSVN